MTDQKQSDHWRNEIHSLQKRAAGASDLGRLAELAERRAKLTIALEALEGDLQRAQSNLEAAEGNERDERRRDLQERVQEAAVKRQEAAAEVDAVALNLSRALSRYFGAAGRHHQLFTQFQHGGVMHKDAGTLPLGANAILSALWAAGCHQLSAGRPGKPFADADKR